LAEDRKALDKEVKILLLGAGESGKSTIAKQMKIIHLKGFTEEEKTFYKALIYSNTVNSMKTLINATRELVPPIELEPANVPLAQKILADASFASGELTKALAQDILTLWKDKGIKKAYTRQNEFQLGDSAAYYISAAARLAEPNYVPNEQDVLRARATTTGIIETIFEINKTVFKLMDVGGQRSERKKWMQCFTDVQAVLFCVALSEYNLLLLEDSKTNRIHESLKLFGEICNSRWFVETSMILFLNKSDLFREKIATVPITVAFPTYTGGSGFEETKDYIKQQFLSVNKDPSKTIYCHVTCATDTNNVKVVFEIVKDTVLQQTLKETGLGI